MTYREQRNGQYWTMLVLGFWFAVLAVSALHTKPWVILFAWGGWELILFATKRHKCWRDDIDLDANVPLDRQGRPLE